ncbi:uncharacterized protein LOC116222095 [Clupea harengus]|uniref:Uncharacterized protein LOC116222095 n=1 Tax=Clupea harengus TaxID=7950 RepID=A0A6P8G485_CLUHA|nr:uncharacterized protein LOC116222095 [Clupea harengus]
MQFGYRHRVNPWPLSDVTGRSHKSVFPPEKSDKKFVLVIGDSHLRSIVDGYVNMPKGCLSFGFVSTPGAPAAVLRKEMEACCPPWEPNMVCIMAPGNNLNSSRTVTEAGLDFEKLLKTALYRWPNVFVLDFPPRLNYDADVQELLRQEYNRISVRLGIRYLSISKHFPTGSLELWCKDGVHLSDNIGMLRLVDLLWISAYKLLEESKIPQTLEKTRAPPPAPSKVIRRAELDPLVGPIWPAGRMFDTPGVDYSWTTKRGLKKSVAEGEYQELVKVSLMPCDLHSP